MALGCEVDRPVVTLRYCCERAARHRRALRRQAREKKPRFGRVSPIALQVVANDLALGSGRHARRTRLLEVARLLVLGKLGDVGKGTFELIKIC